MRSNFQIGITILAFPLVMSGCDFFGGGHRPGKLYGDGGYFGNKVALHDDVALVTAPYDGNGSTFVFQRGSADWNRREKFVGDDRLEEDERYGWSIAVGKHYAVVGSPGDDPDGVGGVPSRSGTVYIWSREGQAWKHQVTLEASDSSLDDNFGVSVAIGEERLAVGATGYNSVNESVGAVYVFRKVDGRWIEEDKLIIQDANSRDALGGAVAIEENYILAAATGSDDIGENSGAAYIFQYQNGDWTRQAKLLADNPRAKDFFGEAVAMDGRYAVVTAPFRDVNGIEKAGAAYVFEREGGTWRQVAKLTVPDPEPFDFFGNALDVSGNNIIVGAWSVDAGRGAAYVFHRQSNGTWDLQAKLQPDETGPSHFFGEDVAIDDRLAIIGMPGEDKEAGAAYIYERVGSTWVPYGTRPNN